jgi:hypothetical protein
MRRRTIAVAGALAALGVGTGAATAVGQGGSSDRVLTGVLRGANEIGEDGQRGAGDPDGFGSATGIFAGRQLCFAFTVRGLAAPQAAHIHRGTRSENGPVVIELRAPEEGDPGTVSGCVNVRSSLARQVLRRPANYYWNVHTERYPAGAIRGQVATARR